MLFKAWTIRWCSLKVLWDCKFVSRWSLVKIAVNLWDDDVGEMIGDYLKKKIKKQTLSDIIGISQNNQNRKHWSFQKSKKPARPLRESVRQIEFLISVGTRQYSLEQLATFSGPGAILYLGLMSYPNIFWFWQKKKDFFWKSLSFFYIFLLLYLLLSLLQFSTERIWTHKNCLKWLCNFYSTEAMTLSGKKHRGWASQV